MQVFREMEIEWRGRPYRVTPSNRLLRRIEGERISLVAMVSDLQAGRPKVSELAYVVAALLESGGATVTEDEMFAELIGADAVAAMTLAADLLNIIFPNVDAKKPSAPPVPAPVPAKVGAKGKAAKPATTPRRR